MTHFILLGVCMVMFIVAVAQNNDTSTITPPSREFYTYVIGEKCFRKDRDGIVAELEPKLCGIEE